LQHTPKVPSAWLASGGVRARGGPRAAAQHGGDAEVERLVNHLRADEVDMAIETTSGDDFALTRNDLGAGPDDDGDARLSVRVTSLADGCDAPDAEADVGLHHTPMIEDQCVGDNGIDRPACPRHLRLAHAVADNLATAEFDLFAINRVVVLDLDK
jgi:hypothetical protein